MTWNGRGHRSHTTDAKVFGIGLNKTGTSSLHKALKRLGFRSLHWGGQRTVRAAQRALDEGLPLLHYLPDYDAYSDIDPLILNFELLDEQYPGSRFILTTRDLEGWLRSRRRHVERNIELAAQGRYIGTFLEVDLDAWAQLYAEHHARVQAYFADRPDDLLVMDITAGDGYEVLCPFLGTKVPRRRFPRENRDARTWNRRLSDTKAMVARTRVVSWLRRRHPRRVGAPDADPVASDQRVRQGSRPVSPFDGSRR